MKIKLFILLFLCSLSVFSQLDIYYFKDSQSTLTIDDIMDKEFLLLNNKSLKNKENTTYWFKILPNNSESHYFFQIRDIIFNEAVFYQNSEKVLNYPNERYLTFRFLRDKTSYIKTKSSRLSNLDVHLLKEKDFIKNGKKDFLFIGLYYGIALLIIVYNISYFFLFKDESFLYYAIFLLSMSLGLFIKDGMLNLIDISIDLIKIISVILYINVAFFSSKFANSYLQLDYYYPKLKNISYLVGILILISGILFLVFDSFYFLVLLKIFVFSLLIAYWLSSILLFKKNVFTKIFAFAYSTLLFSAINLYILKFFGISIGEVSSQSIKLSGYIQMIVLSFGILYRMKILKKQNEYMNTEIINYSNEILKLTELNKNENKKPKFSTLSYREKGIFNLIIAGNSNKEIASILSISVNTVKFHIKNIYEKLNIKSRKEAITIENTTR